MSGLGDDAVAALLKDSLIRIEKLEQQLEDSKEPIAIIGMGCRFPGGANNPDLFWKLLSSGKDGIVEVPPDRWDGNAYYNPDPEFLGKSITKKAGFLDGDITQFDPGYFNMSPLEAETLDPQQRLVLEVTVEALENAGIPLGSLSGSLTGVFLGIYSHDLGDLLNAHINKLTGMFSSTGCSSSIASGRVSYIFDLKGPNQAIDTACSASLVALDNACHYLHSGEINLALVAGVNIMLSPIPFIAMTKANMLAPDGRCKTFDSRADGFGRGEGCGVIVLKRLRDAKRDNDPILALIKGSGVNQDGASNGLTAPNGIAQKELIISVSHKADIRWDEVDYIEAHGTGTPLGDPIEVKAIGETYGQRNQDNLLKIGSVKPNIGHTESAAGIAGLIKIVLMLNHEQIVQNVGFKELNPQIALNFPGQIVTENLPWKRGKKKRVAAINSFGFSGTNAHAVIEEAPLYSKEKNGNLKMRPFHILTLSAKTEAALNTLIQNYVKFLNDTDARFEDICFTSNTGRNHDRYRAAIFATDFEDLKKKLSEGEFLKGKIQGYKSFQFSETDNWEKDFHELAAAYIKGATIDWQKFNAPYGGKKVILPNYPFQREKYWSEAARLEEIKNSSQQALVDEISTSKSICELILKSPKEEKRKYIDTYVHLLVNQIAKIPLGKANFEIPLSDYGFDSLMFGQLANRLITELNLDVNIADMQQMQTLEKLAILIDKQTLIEKIKAPIEEYDSREWKRLTTPKKTDLYLFLCAPFGFGEHSFHHWIENLQENIEVHFVGFQFEKDWSQTIEDLCEKINNLTDMPFIIYGHSMGGIIAYEIASMLQQKFKKKAQKLVISSVVTPQKFSTLGQSFPFNLLPPDAPIDQWIKLLKQANFLPPDLIHLKTISPNGLKRDINAIINYKAEPHRPLACPILTFHALNDVLIPNEKLIKEWKNYTSSTYSFSKIEGSHLFFLSPPKDFFVQLLKIDQNL